MEDSKFWLTIWKIVALTLVAITASIGGCYYGQGQQIKQLTLAGEDPILSMCSIRGIDQYNAAQCTTAQLIKK